MQDVLIVGAGIGGLTAALELARRGIACRVFESAPEIKAVGVGINILPHATEVLAGHGLVPGMASVAVETAEAAFFKRWTNDDRLAFLRDENSQQPLAGPPMHTGEVVERTSWGEKKGLEFRILLREELLRAPNSRLVFL